MAAKSKKPAPAKKTAKPAAKKAPAKKVVASKTTAKAPVKPAAKKPAAAKTTAKSKPAAKSTPAKKVAKPAKAPAKPVSVKKAPAAKKAANKPSAKPAAKPSKALPAKVSVSKPVAKKPAAQAPEKVKAVKISPAFLAKQRQNLLTLKDTLLDSMSGVAKDTLRSRAEGSEGNAFGMHQADAGSDAYDRDFALNLLSQEQNSLYEIDEALKRIEDGTYGVCEMSGKPIPHIRLEALPFTRYTVECQAELEKQNRFRARVPVTSLFGLSDEDGDEDDDSGSDGKD